MWCLVTTGGRRVAIRSLPAVLGSDASADVVLPHDSIAARHALLAPAGDGKLSITAVADALIEVGGWRIAESVLAQGDELVLGRLRFTLLDDRAAALSTDPSPAPSSAPADAEQGELQLRRPAAGAATSRQRTGGRRPGTGTAAGQRRRRTEPLRTHQADGKRGLLHADLSQLGAGQKALILVALAGLCAALVWGLQSVLSAAL